MKKLSNGVWPTMITPYTSENEIDWCRVDNLIEWYIKSGVSGIFAVCLSSEIFHLTLDERFKLAEYIVKKVNKRVQVVSGVLLENPNDIDNIKTVYDKGVDAVVLLSGQIFKQNEEISASYKRLEDIIKKTENIPLGIYESPMPYHKILTPEELKYVVSTDRFYFMKDTSCDIKIIFKKLEVVKKSVCSFYNANTPTLLDSLKIGASGYSGIASNFYPELYSWLCRNFETEPILSLEISDFITVADALIHNKYPVSAKVFQKLLGNKITDFARNSTHKLNDTETASLKSLVRQVKYYNSKI